MGDGCAMEGISNEAASLAAHWKLNKLVVIYDDSHNTIDGDTKIAFMEDVSTRFKALGWNVIDVNDIHDNMESFKEALRAAVNQSEKPTIIKVRTVIGKLSRKEGTSKAHHGTFEEDDVKSMREKVKWEDRDPFHVIPMIYREMQMEGVSPDKGTMATVLAACADLGALEIGRWIGRYNEKDGGILKTVPLYNALLSMFTK